MSERRNQDEPKRRSDRRLDGIIHDDRPVPHDIDAEKAVLAAMMVDPQPCVDIAVEQLSSSTVFYHPTHRLIYEAILKIYNEENSGVDLISVARELKKNNVLEEVGGELHLAEIENTIATSANIENWCQCVKDHSLLRDMINVCHTALDSCYNVQESTEEVLGEIESNILKVREQTVESSIVELKDLGKPTFAYFDDLYNQRIDPGIPSGYYGLDQKITGFKKGEMIVLAARPSIGKTALALNIIRNISLRGDKSKPIALFSLEMTEDQIARRLLCSEADISEKEIYERTIKPSDLLRMTGAVDTFSKAEIFIDATPGLRIAQLRAKSRRLKAKHNIELIVIDYLQLMRGDVKSESRQMEVSEISHGIKALAKELDLPVLVLAQLNREIEKGTGGKPKLSHLRESGAIEQDADIVSFLHRDRDTQKDTSREAQQQGIDAQLIIEKNRNGQTGVAELLFFPKRMLFGDKQRYGDDDKPDKFNE